MFDEPRDAYPHPSSPLEELRRAIEEALDAREEREGR